MREERIKSRHGVQRIDSNEAAEQLFEAPLPNDADEELSLEELSAAYSKLIGEPEDVVSDDAMFVETGAEEPLDLTDSSKEAASKRDGEDTCMVTGRSILEAIFFVGHPESIGLKSEAVSVLMRGVDPSEVDEWIAELNQQYLDNGHAMRIVDSGDGYSMQLAAEHNSVRDSMYGKLRETQLNQAAIDCLALVAYQPGVTREEVEQLWSRPASSILGLLVRRDLLRIEREGKGKQAMTRYFPTDRFLNLIGIASLDDLPIAESGF